MEVDKDKAKACNEKALIASISKWENCPHRPLVTLANTLLTTSRYILQTTFGEFLSWNVPNGNVTVLMGGMSRQINAWIISPNVKLELPRPYIKHGGSLTRLSIVRVYRKFFLSKELQERLPRNWNGKEQSEIPTGVWSHSISPFDLVRINVACTEFTVQKRNYEANRAASWIDSKETTYINRAVVTKENLLNRKRCKKFQFQMPIPSAQRY